MIDVDILQRLQGIPALVTALGGIGQLVLVQAGTALKMPWLIVESTGGVEERIGAATGESKTYFRVSVDAGAIQMMKGRNAIELARNSIHNVRGDLGATSDVYIWCGPVNEYAGLNGAYRYTFNGMASFTVPFTKIHV